MAQGHARLRLLLGELLDNCSVALSRRMAFLLEDMRSRWQELDRRIVAFDAEFATMARTDDRARRLTGIPGIGALNATALVAAVGSAATFDKGRDLAAWLGLVPARRPCTIRSTAGPGSQGAGRLRRRRGYQQLLGALAVNRLGMGTLDRRPNGALTHI